MRTLRWLAPAAALGCSVGARSTSIEREATYACSDDTQCSVGQCLQPFGVCTLDSGDISHLLFEITPRASEAVYGGARYLVEKDLLESDLAGDASRDIRPGWMELNVPQRVPVRGSVHAPDLTSCLVAATGARTTLPATLTFTPRQRLLGLSVPSYEMATNYDDRLREYEFQGALPPGEYDIYMRPDTALLGADCPATPQIFRKREIGSCGSDETCVADTVPLRQPAPAPLRLTIPWQDSLEGWIVDLVQPVTGEIISNRVRLRAEDVAEGSLLATLYHSSRLDAEDEPAAEDQDFIRNGDELVRLTPPPERLAGTVLLQRSGLELLTSGEGVIGDVSSFGAPVNFQAWVWKEGEKDFPVPGVVSFAALDLDALPEGVPVASFSRTAEIDAEGQVSVQLLPGRYRIRVTPPALDDPSLGLLAAYEDTETVWPNPSGSGPTQAGHVIEVPPAAMLEGEIIAEHGGAPLGGLEVRATASAERDPCATSDAGEPDDAPTPCERPPARLLREARAQDAFVPRSRSGLSNGTGKFVIDGLDCGVCEPAAGATFDVSVRPTVERGLAWLVRPHISIDSDRVMQPLVMPTPVGRPVKLTYADPRDEDGVVEARPLPGALVRVFAFIDNGGQVVTDTAGLEPCVTIVRPGGSRCLQSLQQLAEVRSNSSGEFLLLLPPRLE